MNKTLPLLLTLFISLLTFAQAPEHLNYQCVIRDNLGNILSSQPVGMSFNIIQGSTSGTLVYSETWTLNTNAQGLVTVTIGSGMTTDDFSTIDWSNGPYFLGTNVDITGGTNYVTLGSSQLLSVPYALHSKTAGNGLPLGVAGDILYHNGTTWVTLPKGTDGQILTLSGGVPTWTDLCVNTFYLDADNDTYGDINTFIIACEPPAGYVQNNLDCDDTNASINPGANEICGDNIDNDCDNEIDEADSNTIGATTWYQDADGDGYGVSFNAIMSCNQPSGYIDANSNPDIDCNDTDASVYPGAPEIVGDGIDNNCNGETDEQPE